MGWGENIISLLKKYFLNIISMIIFNIIISFFIYNTF